MSISGVAASTVAPPMPQAIQSSAPDRPNDGDGDAGDAPQAVQAAPAPGTGLLVNKSA